MNYNEFEKNPNPTKDQHFMVDKGMLERIYDTARIEPGDSICEIGAGAGALVVEHNVHINDSIFKCSFLIVTYSS